MSSTNSRKYRSISQAGPTDIIDISYDEVMSALLEDLYKNERVIDVGIFILLTEEEPAVLTQILREEVAPVAVWNLLGSPLGRGILLGMLAEMLVARYVQETYEGDDGF